MTNRYFLSGLILLGSMSGNVFACDACAGTIIESGFSTLETAANSQLAAATTLNTNIAALSSTIATGDADITTAIATLGTDLSANFTLMATDIVTSIEGNTNASSANFSLMNKVQQDLSDTFREELKSMLSSALKTYTALDTYNTIGKGGDFAYTGQLNAVLDMYYTSVSIKNNVFKVLMQPVIDQQDDTVSDFTSGNKSLFGLNVKDVMDDKADLITELKYSEILTDDEYKDLLIIAYYGISDDNNLKKVSKQATFIKMILDKAPIFRITDDQLAAVAPFAPSYQDNEYCSSDNVPSGSSCTSTYALLNALENRVATTTYLEAINVTRDKGVMQELNRSITINNIIKARALDMNLSTSLQDVFNEED